MDIHNVNRKICLVSLAAAAFWTAQTSAFDLRAFRQAFLENISVSVELKGAGLVGHVTRSPIYDVEYEAFRGHSDYPSLAYIEVFEVEGELVPIRVPSTDEPLPYFNDLVHPDFRLTGATARDFLELLKAALPSKFDDIDFDRIQQQGEQWQFISSEFLDRHAGFVVTVDETGRISQVAYSLEL